MSKVTGYCDELTVISTLFDFCFPSVLHNITKPSVTFGYHHLPTPKFVFPFLSKRATDLAYSLYPLVTVPDVAENVLKFLHIPDQGVELEA